MLDMLTPSQQMFMLFFSILYGIMLNSLIGYGAFPIAHFFAGEDIISQDCSDEYVYTEGTKSRKRFLLSFFLLNLAPFTYFALVFIYIIPFTNPFPTFLEILFIAFLSLSVFAFFQFFLAFATCRRIRNRIYTPFHFRRLINEKGFQICYGNFSKSIHLLIKRLYHYVKHDKHNPTNKLTNHATNSNDTKFLRHGVTNHTKLTSYYPVKHENTSMTVNNGGESYENAQFR